MMPFSWIERVRSSRSVSIEISCADCADWAAKTRWNFSSVRASGRSPHFPHRHRRSMPQPASESRPVFVCVAASFFCPLSPHPEEQACVSKGGGDLEFLSPLRDAISTKSLLDQDAA